MLLTKGADINGPVSRYLGRTALQAAAERGHLGVVEKLIVAGANINDRNMKNKTALQIAETHGHDEVAAALKRASGK